MEFMQVFFLNTVMDDANELCMETAVSITLRLVSLFIGAEYAEPDAFRSSQKCFWENDLPECVFKYLSNSLAFDSCSNAK